jgi:bacteriophage N4 adsorption protein B
MARAWVIAQMLEHNLAAIRYSISDILVGVYPHDDATAQAVKEVAGVHSHGHMATAPHGGPTSRGDCLNWIFRGMAQHVALHGTGYDIVMTHDAEDLIHADSLRLVSWFSRDYEMVQVPVLALPTPIREFTHGLCGDEFAEFQTKDIPMRQGFGGFLPANGVGAGFSRSALEHLAATRGGQIFDPACLTEELRKRTAPPRSGVSPDFPAGAAAERAPGGDARILSARLPAATRQRIRWVTGIVLQRWQNHGCLGAWPQAYWFWRDRKGLVGNLLSPLANLRFLAGLGNLVVSSGTGQPWRVAALIPRALVPGDVWIRARPDSRADLVQRKHIRVALRHRRAAANYPAGTRVSTVRSVTIWAPPACFITMLRR